MKSIKYVQVLAVTNSMFLMLACQNSPTAPTATLRSATSGNPPASEASANAGTPNDATATSATSSTRAFTLPILTLPKPVITGLSATSAAPGMTIAVYGKDLNPQGAFTSPKVVFAGGPGQYFPQSAQAVSNSELRVMVPSGSGSASVQVQTAGGSTSNLPFTYKVPSLTGVSPASSPRGSTVTLTGTGFGIKQFLDPAYLKFGESVVQATEWTDQRIVVKSPMDFGTGLNSEILFSAIGCLSGSGAASEFEKWIIKASLPGCTTLVKSAFQRYQLSQNPGFVTKNVTVTVRTSAGVSNGRTFTYTVQTETR